MAHCEGCGTDNPVVRDGYTVCCNEPVCYGGVATTGWDLQGNRITEFKHVSHCAKK